MVLASVGFVVEIWQWRLDHWLSEELNFTTAFSSFSANHQFTRSYEMMVRHLGSPCARDSGRGNKHYYRIGLSSRPFVPVTFGPGIKGGFCPGSKG